MTPATGAPSRRRRDGRPAAVLAVDGGGSKTDLAVVARNGRVLAAVRGPSSHYHHIGVDAAMRVIGDLVDEALRRMGWALGAGPVASVGVFCLAGADRPVDDRRLLAAVTARRWAESNTVLNDGFAMLSAGTDRGWGVAVVCGHGINCVGRTQDGRSLRFASLGDISGDWGGGQDVGMAALGAAVRARDGRGPRTKLEESVPRFFGLRRPASVSQAIQLGRIQRRRVGRLAPVVFEAAEAGDDVALAILDRLGDEVALMATAAIRRLHLARTDVHVVLGGGLFRRRNPRLFTRVRDGVVAVAPAADVRTLDAPPVVGAALLGLRQVRAGESTARALRASLTEECLDQGAIA